MDTFCSVLSTVTISEEKVSTNLFCPQLHVRSLSIVDTHSGLIRGKSVHKYSSSKRRTLQYLTVVITACCPTMQDIHNNLQCSSAGIDKQSIRCLQVRVTVVPASHITHVDDHHNVCMANIGTDTPGGDTPDGATQSMSSIPSAVSIAQCFQCCKQRFVNSTSQSQILTTYYICMVTFSCYLMHRQTSFTALVH